MESTLVGFIKFSSLELLLWAVLKSSLIIALAWCGARLLPFRNASVRHALWTVALMGLLLIPLSEFASPGFRPRVPVALAVLTPAEPTPAGVTSSGATDQTAQVRLHSAPAGEAARGWLVEAVPIIALLGTAFFLARLLIGTVLVATVARRAPRVVQGDWLSLVHSSCTALRVRRPVTSIWGERLHLPLTWGLLYPVILLPEAARLWPPERRRHVVFHELAHIRRGDAMTQLAAQLAVALFWFNPLVWFAVRQQALEAEHACDDYVLRNGSLPSAYAATLLDLARSLGGRSLPAFAALSAGRRSDLEVRVRAITDARRDSRASRGLLVACVIAALAVVIPLSALAPRIASALPVSSIRQGTQASNNGDPRRSGSDQRLNTCLPITATGFDQTRGTLTLENGISIYYFFIRPQPGRCIEAVFSMNVRFTDDDRELFPVPGLKAMVREKVAGVDRIVMVTSTGTELQHNYTVNGQSREWNVAAQRWYHGILPEFIRRSLAGIADRARRILERDGVEGLVAELARLDDTSERRDYLLELLLLRSSSALSRERVISFAVTSLGSFEPELASFLAELAAREASAADVREAVIARARALRSPADRMTVLEAMAQHRDPLVRAAALQAIDMLPGDQWRSDLLTRAAPSCLGRHAEVLDAFFAGVDTIHGSSVRGALLMTMLRYEPSAEVLDRIAVAARRIDDSDERTLVERQLAADH
jgi:beta-lactamase regulating signal transducer with metallopeptidase domain